MGHPAWRYPQCMANAAHEKQQYRDRVDAILNKLAEEVGGFHGWPKRSPPGRYIALGQCLTDLCEIPGHDEWFDAAKVAFAKWMADRNQTMTPPR